MLRTIGVGSDLMTWRTPAAEIRVRSEGAKDVVGAGDQARADMCIAHLGDPELGGARA